MSKVYAKYLIISWPAQKGLPPEIVTLLHQLQLSGRKILVAKSCDNRQHVAIWNEDRRCFINGSLPKPNMAHQLGLEYFNTREAPKSWNIVNLKTFMIYMT